MTPDIVHFIYPVNDKTRPFSNLNVQAVKRAFTVHKPKAIRFWSNAKPADIAGWHEIEMMVDLISTTMPVNEWPQYQSDTLRLQILHDQGGIYMDTDLLTTRPLHSVMNDRLCLSWEANTGDSISNALMLVPPKNPFIGEWLRRLPEAQKSSTWAYGGVVLPAEMVREGFAADTTEVMLHGFCCPLDLSQPWLTDEALKEEASLRVHLAGGYAIHCFETFWRTHLPGWEQRDCLLRDLMI